MDGALIIKRDPVTIGAVLNSLIGVVGIMVGWEPILVAGLVGLVTAVVLVIMSANTFGTDKFTSVALNLVGAVLGLLLAFNLEVPDDVTTAILVAVPILLGLFARNGVTNRYGPTGVLKLAPGTAGAGSAGVAGNEAAFPNPGAKSETGWGAPGDVGKPDDPYGRR